MSCKPGALLMPGSGFPQQDEAAWMPGGSKPCWVADPLLSSGAGASGLSSWLWAQPQCVRDHGGSVH